VKASIERGQGGRLEERKMRLRRTMKEAHE
jgi:hypothetical protein